MLKPEAILKVIGNSISRNPVFGDRLSREHQIMLVNNSLIHPVAEGEVLCQQNQYANTLFLIIEGEVEITTLFGSQAIHLGKLGKGELIGEISALLLIPRIATVTVTRPSVVLEIPFEIFSKILSENSEIYKAIYNRCNNRIIETSLRCVPVFKELDKNSLSELCELSMTVNVQKNDVIVHEGKIERSMYVVCSGVARVYITVGGEDVTIALLRTGEYFGEFSLLMGETRSASVSALTDMQLVLLEGESFQSFIEYNEDTEDQINLDLIDRQKSLDLMRDTGIRYATETRLHQIQSILEL